MRVLLNGILLFVRCFVFSLLLVFPGMVGSVFAQNVSIYSWTLPGSVRSGDVRIRHTSASLPDLFDGGTPESISLIKLENAIYARFHNNSSSIIPDGAITVTVDYAEANSGLLPAELVTASGAVISWLTIGSYVMDLEILPGDPPGFGLLPGSIYPTSREVGMPTRYQVLCTTNCDQPLPIAFFLRVRLVYPADTDASDDTSFSYYDLSGATPPSDVVILHDVSGSMSGEIAAAKERAKMFVDLMNKNDRIGVVAFSTQFTGYTQVLASLNLINSIDPSDVAKTFAKNGIDLLNASGATPMGSGVLRAQEVLNGVATPYTNRAIVMLTDGKENQDPRLKEPSYTILNGLNTDVKGAIALYPLWFGTLSHWGKDLLDDIITHVDNGKVVDQPDDDLKLAEAYLMIRGILTSDDIYDIYRGISGDGYEGEIYVDNVTKELIITAAWSSFNRELDVMVLPPGASSWLPASSLPATILNGQIYTIYRFQNPAQGQWKYKLSKTRGSEPYVLAALADQVEILLQSSLEDASIAAGEPLQIKAKLSRGGKPVSGATIQASIAVPERSLGTILNDYRDQFKTPSSLDPSSETTRASGVLKELKGFIGSDQIFSYKPNTITLTDQGGNGIYTGSFTDTKIAGTYRVSITAKNTGNTQGQKFLREHHHAAVVSMGKLDAKRSVIDIAFQDWVGDQGDAIWRVNIIPVDIYGNYVDPGYESKINVEASTGQWLRELADNNDGSYTRFLQLGAKESAQISVSAFGQSLPEKEVQEDKKTKKRAISLHAGTVIPTGTFDNIYDRGSSFTLDYNCRLNPRFSVLLLLGIHDFPQQAGNSEKVFQASANLRIRLTRSSGVLPYVQAGPGIYNIFDEWNAGLNVGAGLIYPASSSVDLEAGSDFHNIFTDGDDVQFWQIHIGFSVCF